VIRKIATVAALSVAVQASAGVQLSKPIMAESKTAKVYDCLEVIHEVMPNGYPAAVGQESRAVIVDFGDTFLARNESAEAFALSGAYKYTRGEYMGDYPTSGVFMGRGFGPSAGSYNYISDRATIYWDCRK